MKRRVLIRLGRRGDSAKAVEDTRSNRVVVYYRDAGGAPRKTLYPRTVAGKAEAKAFVEGWHAKRQRMVQVAEPTLIMAELWKRYAAAELHGLRAATVLNYQYHWRRWEAWVGRDQLASSVTIEDCARFRSEVVARGGSLNQARQTLTIVRGVYRWGVAARIVQDQGVLAFRWKKRKDDPTPIEPDEYSAGEVERLLLAVDRDDARQWRGWVFMMLASHHGQRARALRHLRWSDIDLDAGVVFWRAKFQKQGKELSRPLGWPMWSALLVAKRWRETAAGYRVRDHHTGAAGPARLALADWVLFAERDKSRPVSYQTIHYHLMEAEKRAGIPHRAFTAAHAFRRHVVSEIIERTGDRMLGLEAVGDEDPKMLRSYDKRRQARAESAVSVLDSVPEVSRSAERASVGANATPDESMD